MCLAAVRASTSASSSFTRRRTPASRGRFSAGISGERYLLGAKEEAVSTTGDWYAFPPAARSLPT